MELIGRASLKGMTHRIVKRSGDPSLHTGKARRLLRIKFYERDLALRYFKEEW